MESCEDNCAQKRKVLLGVAGVGLLTFVATFFIAPDRAWASLLLGNFFCLNLALCGATFVALNYVFGSGWAVAFRRVPEAMTAYLPVGAALMLFTLLGSSHLYPWTHADVMANDPNLQHKAPYLNMPFFVIRMVIAFAVWIGVFNLIRRHSQQQDQDGDLQHTRKNQTLSAVFLILFAITFIFASFDWVMSLQPKWFSTIFPGYMFAGILLGGTAMMIILVSRLRGIRALTGITDHHLYELSRLLAGVSTFWAYMWFCQYMLTYYTNIPEETVFFTHWRTGLWTMLFPLNLILNWVVPMLLLVSVKGRRDPQYMTKICIIVLIGRFVDLYQNIIPAVVKPLHLGLPEILIPIACLALFMVQFSTAFHKAETAPRQDPYLAESLHMHVA